MRKPFIFAMSLLFVLGPIIQKKAITTIDTEKKRVLIQYLQTHWNDPEGYVVKKFSEYDYVFIGEFHRIKHDLELIHNLIPRMYEAGVRNLGIEFGAYEEQEKVDALITADEYDEDLARRIMFKWCVYWGHKEYIDIYRKAWLLNKSLPENAERFRIVNLMYRPNFAALQESPTLETWRKVWHKGIPDVHMANIIQKEFVEKNQKALIYSGTHHSFTQYFQPRYNYKSKKLIGFIKNRMGNIIYRKNPENVFHIVLHKPWRTKESIEAMNYPVDGIIDNVMEKFKDKRVGFDIKGSPFGDLRDDGTYYAFGYPDFNLSTFCDGYIFQKHFKDYEGCTIDTKFITDKNLQEAINYFDDPTQRKNLKTIEDFIKLMTERADLKKRLKEQGLE